LEMADPRAEWAKGKSGTVTISDEHGMETP
jgi:hypothetical protein